jgi:large subunit ribosomal protein L4
VRGGGRKPWRQKGLGRARAGTNSSPIWVGGGRAFGPKPRDYSYRLPKKVKRLALHSALSSKVKEEALFTIEDMSWEQPRAKRMAELLSKLGLAGKKCLLVLSETDENIVKSARNIRGVRTINAEELNAYEVANCHTVLFTERAMERFREVHKF